MTMWLLGEGTTWAQFDAATGHVSEDVAPPLEVSAMPPQGWYRWLDGTLVALYGAGGRVWLRIGEVAKRCPSAACVDWVRQANGMARLSLFDGGAVVASVVYFGGDPSGVPPELDFTMSDPEDFDFGEFVRRLLEDPAKVRHVFGESVDYEASEVGGPHVGVGGSELPTPIRAGDLGPLARLSLADYEAAPNPSSADGELSDFLGALEDASAPEPGDGAEQGPSMMPLALGLTDHEREILQVFATRAAQRAMAVRDSEPLQLAVLAAVLGGLNCDAKSPSFVGARRAIEIVGDAGATLGIAPGELVASVALQVGTLGEWRLRQWAEARERRAADA